MKLLGGTMIAHKAVEYDYCLEAALSSLLAVCDEVVVVTTPDSGDGTRDLVDSLRSPKLRIIEAEWRPSPVGAWLADLTNKARLQLNTHMHFSLQADEVLHEDDYGVIRELASAHGKYSVFRLNFWHDHRHLLPPEEKVGSRIVRLAPTSVPSMGDAQSLDHRNALYSNIRIFHYGFIREARKLAAKGLPMLQAFFNLVDPIWDDINKRGKAALIDPANATAVALDRLSFYGGSHPRTAHAWLKAHGYNL